MENPFAPPNTPTTSQRRLHDFRKAPLFSAALGVFVATSPDAYLEAPNPSFPVARLSNLVSRSAAGGFAGYLAGVILVWMVYGVRFVLKLFENWRSDQVE